MKKEYYNDLFGGKKYGDYMVYGLDKSESKYSDYSDYTDLLNQLGSYYNATTFQEESEEQKAIREAKEKAQKRNNTIDQILGE
jgi:hypothetical protein